MMYTDMYRNRLADFSVDVSRISPEMLVHSRPLHFGLNYLGCPKVGHLLCAAVRAKKKMGLVQFIRLAEQPPPEQAEDADSEARVSVPDEVEAR
jgi:hypothetical protein